MGGTFDPIHHGHLCAAGDVAEQLELDEVVFVPTGAPWQKSDFAVSDPEDRYAMTLLAAAAHPVFRVSRVDVERSGPTYTVDTLRDLRQFYGPKASLCFITGADTLERILSWKSVDEVFEAAQFAVVNRPGHSVSRAHLPPHAKVSVVETRELDISSTDCRQRAAQGRSLWYLTPSEVVRYIERRGLYRTAAHS